MVLPIFWRVSFQVFRSAPAAPRTAVADQSGAKTQLTGVFAAVLVLLLIVFAPGLFRNLPQTTLAAIVIVASISLFNLREFLHLWRVRKSEFAIAVISLLVVVLFGVLEGIVIAVVISILKFFQRAWRPYSAILGKPDRVPGYHDIKHYPHAYRNPGLVIVRWDAPLFFANANLFRKWIRELVSSAQPKPVWILVAAEPITDVDTTAADVLVDLDMELNSQGIHLALAELKDPVREKIERYGLYETINRRHFYPTIDRAVQAFNEELRQGIISLD